MRKKISGVRRETVRKYEQNVRTAGLQLASQACTPRGEPLQGAGAKLHTRAACYLGAKMQKMIEMHSHAQIPTVTQSLVTTIQPTVFWPPKPPSPHWLPMQKYAKLFVSIFVSRDAAASLAQVKPNKTIPDTLEILQIRSTRYMFVKQIVRWILTRWASYCINIRDTF